MSLAPVGPAVAQRIGKPVLFLHDCVGEKIEGCSEFDDFRSDCSA